MMNRKVVSSIGFFPNQEGGKPFVVFLKFDKNGYAEKSCPSRCFQATQSSASRLITLVKGLVSQEKGRGIPTSWGWLYSTNPCFKQVLDG
jgi:hypothetical protein